MNCLIVLREALWAYIEYKRIPPNPRLGAVRLPSASASAVCAALIRRRRPSLLLPARPSATAAVRSLPSREGCSCSAARRSSPRLPVAGPTVASSIARGYCWTLLPPSAALRRSSVAGGGAQPILCFSSQREQPVLVLCCCSAGAAQPLLSSAGAGAVLCASALFCSWSAERKGGAAPTSVLLVVLVLDVLLFCCLSCCSRLEQRYYITLLLFYSSDWLLLVFCFSAAPEVSCGWTVVQHRFFI